MNSYKDPESVMRKLKSLTQDCDSVAESEQREGQDGEREIVRG